MYNNASGKKHRFPYFINLTRNSSTLRPLDLDVQATFYQFPSIIEREHMPDRSMLVLLSCFRSRQKCRQCVLYLLTSKVHKLKLAFSRNTLMSVPSGNPRSETPHALGIPVQRTPPCLRNSSSKNPPCLWNSEKPSVGGYGYFLESPNSTGTSSRCKCPSWLRPSSVTFRAGPLSLVVAFNHRFQNC